MGSYHWDDNNFSINIRPLLGRAIDITTINLDSCSDQTMNPKDSNVYRKKTDNQHAT